MKPVSTTTSHQVAELLRSVQQGDPSALNALINRCADRLRQLAHDQMLRFPTVRRWEGSDDLMQQASLRLIRALRETRPATAPQLFALASEVMRRQLVDFYRHYYGPEGLGRHHATPTDTANQAAVGEATAGDDPHLLSELTELHEQAGQLPDDLRAVFDLRWYQGLSVDESAQVLGVSAPTIKRRWREARLALQQLLDE